MDALNSFLEKYGINESLLLNPALTQEEKNKNIKIYQKSNLTEHFWFMTSGSSGQPKLVALSQKALLNSAVGVNEHLAVTKKDVWGLCLPHFHVGGLGILIRAFVSESSAVKFETKWSAGEYYKFLENQKVTITALVPTQVFDLLVLKKSPPSSLRAVVVGGGALAPNLWFQGIKLGWPLLPSYGLTESGSQVATAEIPTGLNSTRDELLSKRLPFLKILPHAEIKLSSDKKIIIRASSLLTCYGCLDTKGDVQFKDPKDLGWFETEDFGDVNESGIEVYGRGQDFIKSSGELINLVKLRGVLQTVLNKVCFDGEIIDIPDERLGALVALVLEKKDEKAACEIEQKFNSQVMPFEKIKKTLFVDKLPKSPLGKIQIHELKNDLQLKFEK